MQLSGRYCVFIVFSIPYFHLLGCAARFFFLIKRCLLFLSLSMILQQEALCGMGLLAVPSLSAEAIQAKKDFDMGCMLIEDEGSEQDFHKALDCFERAAAQDADLTIKVWAYFRLGLMYYFGQGVNDTQKKELYLTKIREKTFHEAVNDIRILHNDSTIILGAGASAMLDTGVSAMRGNDRSLDLHIACMLGQKKLLGVLLKDEVCQKNIDTSYLGFRPIHWAIWSNSKEIVEQLLSAGARVRSKKYQYEEIFIMHYAAAFGNPAIIKLLLATERVSLGYLAC